MNAAIRKLALLAAALAIGTAFQACATGNNCDCPDNGQECGGDVTQDVAQDTLPGEDTAQPADTAGGDASDTVVPNDFLTGSATISGKVTFTNLTDHSGIDIKLFDENAWYRDLASTSTAADGTWSISGIPAGMYTVIASKDGFTVEDQVIVFRDMIDDGDTVTARDGTLTAAGIIRGVARFENFPEWWIEDNSGISVYLPGRDPLVLTDADGNWTIGRVKPGQYLVCAGFESQKGECVESVQVTALQYTDVAPLAIVPGDSGQPAENHIHGKVTMAGVEDASGITVKAYWSWNLVGETTTDADGNYEFDDIEPGDCQFQFSAPAASGYEQNADFGSYPIYGGVDETIPPQTLGRGRAVSYRYANMMFQAAEFTPDSSRILVRTDDNVLFVRDPAVPDEENGSTFIDRNVGMFTASPDSSFVAYDQIQDDALLFIRPLDGGPRRLLTFDRATYWKFTPDSTHVLFGNSSDTQTSPFYTADAATGETTFLCNHDRLAVLPVTGDSSHAICLDVEGNLTVAAIADGVPLYEQAGVGRGILSPDSSTLVTCAATTGVLAAVDMATGTVQALQGTAGSCDIIVTGAGVLFLSADDTLMLAPIDGGATVLLADDALTPLDVTPDQSKVIAYKRAANDAFAAYDVYAVDMAGGGTPVLLATRVGHHEWGSTGLLYDRSGLSQDRGYMLGKNSDVIYIETEYSESYEKDLVLHMVALDGSSDIAIMQLGDLYMAGHVLWDVNEDLGFAIGNVRDGSVSLYKLADGQTSPLDAPHGAGLMSPDRASLIRYTGSPAVLTWYTIDGTETLPLLEEPFDDWNLGQTTLWYQFSPDSKHILYATLFGRTMNGYMEWARQGIYLVDLE